MPLSLLLFFATLPAGPATFVTAPTAFGWLCSIASIINAAKHVGTHGRKLAACFVSCLSSPQALLPPLFCNHQEVPTLVAAWSIVATIQPTMGMKSRTNETPSMNRVPNPPTTISASVNLLYSSSMPMLLKFASSMRSKFYYNIEHPALIYFSKELVMRFLRCVLD